MSAEKESARLKALKARLNALSQEFYDDIAEQVAFSAETKAALPADYRAKSTWGDFAKAQREAQRIATMIGTLASSLDWGISLAEVVEMSDE